jgi:putative spermidine/putrescine transport system permease protein
LILPLSVGVVVKAFAWTILLRSDGIVNRLLLAVGIVEAPVRLLFTESGLVLGAVNIFLPFMVLPIFAVVKLIDPRLLDAAATLGASPLHRFVRVTLPLTMPGVVAGIAFVFSMSVSMYVIPTLLMGDRFKTLSILVARSFLFMRDRSLGSTVSVVLLVIAVAVVVASALLARRWQKHS